MIDAVLFKAWVQVVSRQKLNCNRENIEVYRAKYDIFSIRIEFLTTNDLDPVFSTLMHPKDEKPMQAPSKKMKLDM